MGLAPRTQGIVRLILAIALPAIVTNITTPLLGLCDIAIAGHRGGAAFIASLAVATSMFNMLYWGFGFLRMGSSGLTAQAFGASNREGQALVLWRGVMIAVAAGVALVAVQRPAASFLLRAMDVDPATSAYAMRYFRIVVWGAPAMLSLNVFTGWFLGMQNSRVPMWVSLLADVSNIAVSLIMVFAVGLDIEGVAIGTLSAQWLSALVALCVCLIKFKPMGVSLSGIVSGSGLALFFRVNSDIFLRTLCLIAVTLWFTRCGAVQGDTMLAVNALVMQLFTLFSYVMDGFAFSSEALVGRWVGSGNREMLRLTVRTELNVGAVMAILFTILYFVCGDEIFRLLTSDEGVRASAHDYLPWAITIPLAGFMAFSCDGIMIGMGRTRAMLGSMATAMAVFFGLYFMLFKPLGNHGLWIAFVAYLATRGLILVALLRLRYLRQ